MNIIMESENKKLKILFILTEGFDTAGPSNHLMEALLEDTSNAGIDIQVIESHRSGIFKDIPDVLQKPNINFDILKRRIIKKSNFILRYLEEMNYAYRCRKIYKHYKDIDLVFVQSCPTALYSILFAKITLRKKIIYSIQDMFPGSSIASGVMTKRWMQQIFFVLQKLAYKYSDYITVISEDMKDKVLHQGADPNKVYTIVNWYDDKSIKEIQIEENLFIKKYNLSKSMYYVQYAGTMGYVFDYEMILNVAEKLKKFRNIEFHMIGTGSQKNKFQSEADKRGLNNIKFFPLEPQSMVSHVYSACNICFIPLKKGVIGNSVPSKIALLMACKRLILTSVDKDSKYFKMFDTNKIGLVASNEDYENVANQILDAYRNTIRTSVFIENGYNFAKKYYSRANNTIQFINLFRIAGEEK